MTYREIVNMINDELKQESDDSWFTLDHIRFLCNKYRCNILKKVYDGKLVSNIDPCAFQTLKLSFEISHPNGNSFQWDSKLLKSIGIIPQILVSDSISVYVPDLYNSTHISVIPYERMKFTGASKWLRNIIYCSISPDSHLYVKSGNSQFMNLKELDMTAIFSDPEKVYSITDPDTDIMDMEFPMEDYLVPQLVLLVVKELGEVQMRPEDNKNNSKDDLSDITEKVNQYKKDSK